MEKDKVLSIKNLSITFTTNSGDVNAIRGVDFDLYRGETLAIVGESGSGKSVTTKAAIGILASNGRINSGEVIYSFKNADGTERPINLLNFSKREMRKTINGKRIAMIFQDPMTSLDPTMKIGTQIMESMLCYPNKLKARYNDLITSENVDYKFAKKQNKQDYESKKDLIKESYKKDISEAKKKKQGVSDIKNDYKNKLKEIKTAFDNQNKNLDMNFKKSKSSIKEDCEKYRLSLLKKRDDKIAKATDEMKDNNDEEFIAQKNKEIESAKRDYISQTKVTKEYAKSRALELLKLVGITDAEKRINNYPHQLSGGMRQRVVIAIALACSPDILICDEPTTALDVTIQAKILDLIKKLQKKLGISIIFITHNLGVVAKVADYVCVMYAGKRIEKGLIDEIFYEPAHPYTWGLLSSMPDLNTNDKRLYTIPGSAPNLLHKPQGDPFTPRNKYALKIDTVVEAPMFKISETHYASTWLLDPRAPKVEMPKELKDRIEKMKGDFKNAKK